MACSLARRYADIRLVLNIPKSAEQTGLLWPSDAYPRSESSGDLASVQQARYLGHPL